VIGSFRLGIGSGSVSGAIQKKQRETVWLTCDGGRQCANTRRDRRTKRVWEAVLG
jgi:hypothetical protein